MTVSPQNDLSYLGVRAPNPPNQIVAKNAPTANDYRFPIGTLWLDEVANTSWQLTHVAGTTATWTALGTGAVGGIVTITGDVGGAESPLVGNFSLLGTANQVKVTGGANKETFSLIGPYTPATYTLHGVLVGAGTSSIVALGAAATGTVLTGVTGANPAFSATPSVTSLTTTGALLVGTTITATAGDITATLGNVILNGAAKHLSIHGGAVTDFIGQATLINGVATVLNTNIAATDRILTTRSAKNASTAYGTMLTTITPATSFVLTACKSDTTTEAGDQSTIDYVIIRQV